MAVGKNKNMSKGGKKGAKKKTVDPFTRKEWYTVRAPSHFSERHIGHTLVNKTQGTRIATDGLKGRVFEVSLGDLNKNSDEAFRKFRLIVEDVQGKHCLTNFHGMDFTRDKLCSMVRKWQTLIESNCVVKTSDGYTLRVFVIGFTKKNSCANKKTAYAQASKVRMIRAKMNEIVQKEFACELKEVVRKLIPDSVVKDIERECRNIYPLYEVHVRKVKVLRKPKFDLGKLMEMHGDIKGGNIVGSGTQAGDGGDAMETGDPLDRPDGYEPPVKDDI